MNRIMAGQNQSEDVSALVPVIMILSCHGSVRFDRLPHLLPKAQTADYAFRDCVPSWRSLALTDRTALSASKKPAETEAKQAADQGSEAKHDRTKKAFLRKLPPHIQT